MKNGKGNEKLFKNRMQPTTLPQTIHKTLTTENNLLNKVLWTD